MYKVSEQRQLIRYDPYSKTTRVITDAIFIEEISNSMPGIVSRVAILAFSLFKCSLQPLSQ